MGMTRQAFGLEALDRRLGGGLLPGTLTVIAGATGAGKTQLGLTWAAHGRAVDGRAGVICDLTSRGDAQNHKDYAQRLFNWELAEVSAEQPIDLDVFWSELAGLGEYYHPFRRAGRRVTRRDLDPDEWHAWKSDLARVLRRSVAFFYGHFTRGARRVLVDGIEPTERFSESIQFEFFEYLYHQVLRQEDDWVARELFRERFLSQWPTIEQNRYDAHQVGCLYLYTTPHVLLDDLMAERIAEGDIFTNANTIILMGRTRELGRFGRALYIAKHRGSACSDEIINFRVTEHGLEFPN